MANLADLSYDPATGVFTWLVKPQARVAIGAAAGSLSVKGYRCIKVAGTEYRASRLAWFFAHGEWPPAGIEVDHINGNRADDRISNLRLATTRENCRNRGVNRTNTTGVKGVSLKEGRYVARISAGSKRLYLGSYETAAEARAAYAEAARRHHGDFARVA